MGDRELDGGGDIIIDLQEVRWRGIGWIDMVQDRDRRRALVNAVMNIRVP